MHICFVTIDYHGSDKGGGIGSYISTIGKELVKQDHRVSVVYRQAKGESSFADSNGIREWRVPFGSLHYYVSKIPLLRSLLTLPLRELEWSYALSRMVRQVHKQDPIDLVESCETGNLWATLFPIGIPWLIRAHGATYSFKKFSVEKIGISERLDRWLQRFCMLRSSALSAPSLFQAEQIKSELDGRKPVNIIPNPVDKIFYGKTSAEKRDKTTGKGSIRILYTGRLASVKGILILLRAMQLISIKMIDIELAIAGGRHSSVNPEILDKLLSTEAMQRKVKLLGHVPWQSLKRFYDSCDVFVVPSYYETFCISAAEAMACGKPVIGTSGSALDELVADGVNGLLVSPGNSEALAEAITKLADDKILAQEMGARGHERARSFSPETVVQSTMHFYEITIKNSL